MRNSAKSLLQLLVNRRRHVPRDVLHVRVGVEHIRAVHSCRCIYAIAGTRCGDMKARVTSLLLHPRSVELDPLFVPRYDMTFTSIVPSCHLISFVFPFYVEGKGRSSYAVECRSSYLHSAGNAKYFCSRITGSSLSRDS